MKASARAKTVGGVVREFGIIIVVGDAWSLDERMRDGMGYGVPRDLFTAVTVPVPTTVQPIALVALMATPPLR